MSIAGHELSRPTAHKPLEKKPITIAFLEDDRVYRTFLNRLLKGDGRYQVLGGFATIDAALMGLSPTGVQVMLVDIGLSRESGIEAVRKLQRKWPRLRCVILTGSEKQQDLLAALKAGAAGYLLKSEPPHRILAGLEELLAGGVPLSRSVAAALVNSFATKPVRGIPAALTRREVEILEVLAAGLTYKEIALKLGISAATVKNHLGRLYKKLGVRSRAEAVLHWFHR